jgi:hypothetical protein
MNKSALPHHQDRGYKYAMVTVFDKIPTYFVERYDEEICAWAKNFPAIGPVKSIVLKEGRLSDISPDEQAGAVLRQVKLIARMERLRGRVTITPYDESDERMIANHCRKMEKAGWPARLFDKEPARPWIPFMPTVDPPGRNEQAGGGLQRRIEPTN